MDTLTLRVPKLRAGSFFPDAVIERYQCVDRAITAVLQAKNDTTRPL